MSKKFFSLIHGDRLHIAPKTKVIPADSLSTLMDAKEALEAVHQDTEEYRTEVASECEKLKEQAQKEGYEQGYAEWLEKIAELELEIKKVRKEVENVIVPIALKAAKKIVGRELELSEATVVDIITNSLKSVATHKRIKIYVNKKQLELVEKHKEQLKSIFEHLEALSILAQDDIDPAGCIIETEGGIINAQLENQWMILENAFQKLINSKKVTPSPSKEKQLKAASEDLSEAEETVKKSVIDRPENKIEIGKEEKRQEGKKEVIWEDDEDEIWEEDDDENY
jgi:type III secretion protein L